MKNDVSNVIARARAADASFYRDLWGKADTFEKLPTVSRADFIRAPLSRRRYKEERSLVKIVHDGDAVFLSEWSFDDIAREPWGVRTKRPMVYLSDPHEAIEKSMWCYDNGMVPLLGERDPDIAAHAARMYEVDQLITDPDALEKLRRYLDERATQLESLTLIAPAFDDHAFATAASYAKHARFVLARPETGAIAILETGSDHFVPVDGVQLDTEGDTILLTKLALLVTPIIKYRTDIPAAQLRS